MTMPVKTSLFAIIILALFLAACQGAGTTIGQEVSVEGGTYTVVSAQKLQTMLEDKDFTLINVHIPWQGDIPKTDLRLAYDQIEQNQNQLPTEKDSRIVVYCLTSGMAKIAVTSLFNLGYTNLSMLDGGTTAWEEAGLSLIK